MEPNFSAMLIGLCILGDMAILPLIISVGLIGVMRQVGNWIESKL